MYQAGCCGTRVLLSWAAAGFVLNDFTTFNSSWLCLEGFARLDSTWVCHEWFHQAGHQLGLFWMVPLDWTAAGFVLNVSPSWTSAGFVLNDFTRLDISWVCPEYVSPSWTSAGFVLNDFTRLDIS